MKPSPLDKNISAEKSNGLSMLYLLHAATHWLTLQAGQGRAGPFLTFALVTDAAAENDKRNAWALTNAQHAACFWPQCPICM